MKVMVTGGAGFIGSAVCRFLVGELNATVLNVDKLTYAANLASLREVEANPRYAFRRADVCDRQAMSALLQEFDPDAVLHLAAESHVDRRGFRLARGHRQIYGGHTLPTELALLGIESGLRSPGPRVAGNLWAAHS